MTTSPRKRTSERRQRQLVLRCRVLPLERQEIERRASTLGISVSELLRQSALDKPIRRPKKRLPSLDTQLLAHLSAQLGKVGSNLNQIARIANTSGRLDSLSSLEAALSELLRLVRRLTEALA